jgi:hypothetical protein
VSAAQRRRRIASRGQGLVEFAMLVPVFLVLLLGMLELGLAFTHNLTLEYSTREGARVGAALVNGGGALGCGAGQSPNAATVDPLIIAAVERVLTSPGSQVRLADVSQIRIYKADGAGDQASAPPTPPGSPTPVNVWTYRDPLIAVNPTVGSQELNFYASSTAWPACGRTNSTALPGPDSLGVSLAYTYRFQTGLGAIARFIGGGMGPTLQMTDRTIMALNPTQ